MNVGLGDMKKSGQDPTPEAESSPEAVAEEQHSEIDNGPVAEFNAKQETKSLSR